MKDGMIDEMEKALVVPSIVSLLEMRVGEECAIKSQQVIDYLLGCGHKVEPGRFRLMINYIRSNDLVIGLVADSRGYYRTTDPKVIEKWIEKEKGIIRQKTGPLKRMRIYLKELYNKPGLQIK
ncbi:MAG: hypothetical protein KGO82_16560 [Bacteroidota bacterium]|nr:hypothetical protein [Bacteroidota bacterium]